MSDLRRFSLITRNDGVKSYTGSEDDLELNEAVDIAMSNLSVSKRWEEEELVAILNYFSVGSSRTLTPYGDYQQIEIKRTA